MVMCSIFRDQDSLSADSGCADSASLGFMIALPLVGAQDPPQPKRRRLVGKQPGVAVPLPQQAAMWRCGPCGKMYGQQTLIKLTADASIVLYTTSSNGGLLPIHY